jgi:hypothetical protein
MRDEGGGRSRSERAESGGEREADLNQGRNVEREDEEP